MRHGGTLAAASSDSEGTVFSARLPRHAAAAALRPADYCRATLSSSSTPRLMRLVTRCASEASICFASVRSQISTTAPTIFPSRPRKGEARHQHRLDVAVEALDEQRLAVRGAPASARPSAPFRSLIIWPAESHQPSISPYESALTGSSG